MSFSFGRVSGNAKFSHSSSVNIKRIGYLALTTINTKKDRLTINMNKCLEKLPSLLKSPKMASEYFLRQQILQTAVPLSLTLAH